MGFGVPSELFSKIVLEARIKLPALSYFRDRIIGRFF